MLNTMRKADLSKQELVPETVDPRNPASSEKTGILAPKCPWWMIAGVMQDF